MTEPQIQIEALLRHLFYLERSNADSAEKRAELARQLAASREASLQQAHTSRLAQLEAEQRAADSGQRSRHLADRLMQAHEAIALLTEQVRRGDQRINTLHDLYGARLRRLDGMRLVDFFRTRRVRRAGLQRSAQVVRDSRLFDPAWYLRHYEDVRSTGRDPAMHYVARGAAEGRDPGPHFSTTWYVRTYPDVLASELNALEHFERFGQAAGYRTGPPEPMAAEAADDTVQAPAPGETEAPAPVSRSTRIVFISGDDTAPGHRSRVLNLAEAARALGADTEIFAVPQAAAYALLIERADLVIIWRAAWNAEMAAIAARLHDIGARVVFDVDALLVDPDHARIDGLEGDELRAFVIRMQQTMNLAEFCLAPGAGLVEWLRRTEKPVLRLPSGFSAADWRTARRAVRTRRQAGACEVVRIGCFPRSRAEKSAFEPLTHMLARVLRDHPDARLVLSAPPEPGALDGVAAQIELRQAVPPEDEPWELARLDILLVPGLIGDPFFESSDEIRFVEAALAGVPTLATATRGYRDSIRDGQTGVLATDEASWEAALRLLLNDPSCRTRLAGAAYHDIVWNYGPERRCDLVACLLEQILHRGRRAGLAFELGLARQARPRAEPAAIPDCHTILAHDRLADAEVTIVVPLYNYAGYVVEALESVRAQSLADLDLVVVDDCSTDNSLSVARDWMQTHAGRFGRMMLLRNSENRGLALTRNAGFAAAETPFVLPLDADNILLADCAARCLDAIRTSGAAFAYPALRQFGDRAKIFSDHPYDPARFASGNYIDATALVRLAAWAAVGFYHPVQFGWEDYDLWCRFAEHGLFGIHVPEVLGLYRVHASSMLRSVADAADNKRRLIDDMRRRHPWVLQGVGWTE